jgi:hypothetical protein
MLHYLCPTHTACCTCYTISVPLTLLAVHVTLSLSHSHCLLYMLHYPCPTHTACCTCYTIPVLLTLLAVALQLRSVNTSPILDSSSKGYCKLYYAVGSYCTKRRSIWSAVYGPAVTIAYGGNVGLEQQFCHVRSLPSHYNEVYTQHNSSATFVPFPLIITKCTHRATVLPRPLPSLSLPLKF